MRSSEKTIGVISASILSPFCYLTAKSLLTPEHSETLVNLGPLYFASTIGFVVYFLVLMVFKWNNNRAALATLLALVISLILLGLEAHLTPYGSPYLHGYLILGCGFLAAGLICSEALNVKKFLKK